MLSLCGCHFETIKQYSHKITQLIKSYINISTNIICISLTQLFAGTTALLFKVKDWKSAASDLVKVEKWLDNNNI